MYKNRWNNLWQTFISLFYICHGFQFLYSWKEKKSNQIKHREKMAILFLRAIFKEPFLNERKSVKVGWFFCRFFCDFNFGVDWVFQITEFVLHSCLISSTGISVKFKISYIFFQNYLLVWARMENFGSQPVWNWTQNKNSIHSNKYPMRNNLICQ
jgi:hypothetical protein